MAYQNVEDKVGRVIDVVAGGHRMGVSDFARSRTWRDELGEKGIVEVVDRSDTVGYLMSPEYAASVAEFIKQLEEDLERAHIREVFEQRKQYAPAQMGDDLLKSALAEFDAHAERIEGLLNGSR